jgi:hypothetical protein
MKNKKFAGYCQGLALFIRAIPFIVQVEKSRFAACGIQKFCHFAPRYCLFVRLIIRQNQSPLIYFAPQVFQSDARADNGGFRKNGEGEGIDVVFFFVGHGIRIRDLPGVVKCLLTRLLPAPLANNHHPAARALHYLMAGHRAAILALVSMSTFGALAVNVLGGYLGFVFFHKI